MQNYLYMYPNLVSVRKNTLTQAELAEQIGITQQEISRYERGEIKAPISYITDVARICNVSVDYILGLSDDSARDGEPADIDDRDSISPEIAAAIASVGVKGFVGYPSNAVVQGNIKRLLRRKSKNSSPDGLSDDEIALLEAYRSLSETDRIRLSERAQTLLEKDKR